MRNNTLIVLLTTPVAPKQPPGLEVHDQGVDDYGLSVKCVHSAFEDTHSEAIALILRSRLPPSRMAHFLEKKKNDVVTVVM